MLCALSRTCVGALDTLLFSRAQLPDQVLVVSTDVMFPVGTESIFNEDPSVMVISIHRQDFEVDGDHCRGRVEDVGLGHVREFVIDDICA